MNIQHGRHPSGSDEKELETVKNNYLIKKLGLKDSPDLMAA